MKELARALLAIGAGVILGVFVAAQFNFFWWLGMLAGGLTAYLVCDWPGVVRAAKHAWKFTLGISKEDWKTFGWLAIAASSAATTCTAAVFLLVLFAARFKLEKVLMDIPSWLSMWALCGVLFIVLPFIDNVNSHANRLEKNIQVAKLFNPFKIFIYWPVLCLIWFFRLLTRIPWALVAIGRFVKVASRFIWRTLVMIHSEARLFCLVDAAIGVATFHFTGNNLLVGLIVGEALGVIGHLWLRHRQALETKGGAPA